MNLNHNEKVVNIILIIIFLLIIPAMQYVEYFDAVKKLSEPSSIGGIMRYSMEMANLNSELARDIILSTWFVFSIFVATYASNAKGLCGFCYFLFALAASPIIAFITALLSKPVYDADGYCDRHSLKQCNHCFEYINSKATICKYCQSEPGNYRQSPSSNKAKKSDPSIKKETSVNSLKDVKDDFKAKKKNNEERNEIVDTTISEKEKIEVVKSALDTREGYFSIINEFPITDQERDILALASVQAVKNKLHLHQDLVDRVYEILIKYN